MAIMHSHREVSVFHKCCLCHEQAAGAGAEEQQPHAAEQQHAAQQAQAPLHQEQTEGTDEQQVPDGMRGQQSQVGMGRADPGQQGQPQPAEGTYGQASQQERQSRMQEANPFR